jgi:hypothetical protein
VNKWLGQRGWYGSVGSVELAWPRAYRFIPHVGLTRNGRCVGLDASIGDFYVSVAVYRHWSES